MVVFLFLITGEGEAGAPKWGYAGYCDTNTLMVNSMFDHMSTVHEDVCGTSFLFLSRVSSLLQRCNCFQRSFKIFCHFNNFNLFTRPVQ